MNFLRSGGSDFPLKQLEKAGIDMRSKKTYQAVIDLFVEKASVI
jgi:oligoendopeptidase F